MRNPSGSSGGSASAVAANFGLVGIGEDTGGSMRGPAAVSSLVGLRPTLPLVSRFGMLPANPTQDTMGPMTRTVTDAALLLDVMVGYDPNDPITAYAVGQIAEEVRCRRSARRAERRAHRRDPAARDTSTSARRRVRDSTLSATRGRRFRRALPGRRVREGAPVMERAIAELRALGATLVDSLVIPGSRARRARGNDFETEQATDAYFRAASERAGARRSRRSCSPAR